MRRKFVVLTACMLVPLAAGLLSLSQQKLYAASADVLLSRQNLANSLTGTPDPTYQLADADRVAQTQAAVASSPEVARRTLAAAGARGTTEQQFLQRASVKAQDNADILNFRVKDPEPSVAERLVNQYANQFAIYRRELDTSAIGRARDEVVQRLRALDAQGQRRSALYSGLENKESQLRTLEALQTSNAFVIRRATDANKAQPQLTRNVILGLLLGVIIGGGLAFVWDALDTRVRSADEIGDRLHIPLLARIPAPAPNIRSDNGLVMLEDARSPAAEAYRMLRTSLDFVNLDRSVKRIMITSAVESEGKSTTISNLAVALARLGRRVVLVDLDLRRPFVHRFFRLVGQVGVTDVALGRVSLGEALCAIPIDGADGNAGGQEGTLQVLTAGPLPPDAGEFVQKAAVARILDDLRDIADVVLIDAPPMLRVGDPMSLSAHVDGILLMARLSVLRRPMLSELRRLLIASPAEKLGFVVAGAELEQDYGGGYYSYYYQGAAQGSPGDEAALPSAS